MRLRIRYDQEVWLAIAFLLFLAFLAAVGPFWFGVGVGERLR